MTTPPCTDIDLPPLGTVIKDAWSGFIGAFTGHKDGYLFLDMGEHVEWRVRAADVVPFAGWNGRKLLPRPRSAPPIESYPDDEP
jgi:hypothetical protein